MKENSTLTKEQKIALKAEKKSEKAALRKEKREEKCKLLAKKKTKMTVFRQMQENFSPEEKAKINHHFEDFKLHCHMAKKETDFLHEDIEEALLYYKNEGKITLDEALRRLSNEKLGGFYANPASLWFALDDAAKIYPFSMREGYMSVFRMA